MMSMNFPPIYGAPVIEAYGSIFDERAEQLRAQDAAARDLAFAAEALLNRITPGHKIFTRQLRDSFIGFICCGTERQLKSLEDQKAQSAKFSGPSDEDRLVELVEQRDRETAEMDEVDRAFDKLPEDIGEAMKLALVQQLRRNLEWKDKEISALQKKIERKISSSAATPGPRETEITE